MSTGTEFDYYYGEESNQFSYYRIPRQLVSGKRFKRLSTDAKLLYGLLLDRMGLSVKNGWYDEAGRVYIYYTLEEIQKDLNCGHEKAVKLLAELDKGKGIGLIERKKQGQGRPAKIYVKRFTTRAVPPAPPAPDPDPQPRFPNFGNTDFRKSEVKTSENRKCRLRKTDSSYIKSSQTDFSYIDPSIHPSPSAREQEEGWIDRYDCEEEIKAQMGTIGGMSAASVSVPQEMIDTIENVGFLASIPLWLVTLLGSLFITILSFILILTVYGRFFRLYMYTALAPLPLASFAGEGTSFAGKAFLKSYIGACMEGAIIVLACLIFSAFAASSPPVLDISLSAVTMSWQYVAETIFNMLVLVALVKGAERIVKEMFGL